MTSKRHNTVSINSPTKSQYTTNRKGSYRIDIACLDILVGLSLKFLGCANVILKTELHFQTCKIKQYTLSRNPQAPNTLPHQMYIMQYLESYPHYNKEKAEES